MELGWQVVFTGIGATALMDAAMLVRRRILGMPLPDYGLVGRWIAHMPRGRLVHERMASVAAVTGERAIGWAAHYAIGIGFAALLYAVAGGDWFRAPTMGIALAVGLCTVAAPFLVMQPAMGAGFLGTKTATPVRNGLRSLANHTVFGAGLYLAASALAWIAG